MRKSTLKKWRDRKKEMVPRRYRGGGYTRSWSRRCRMSCFVTESSTWRFIRRWWKRKPFTRANGTRTGFPPGYTASKARPLNNLEDLEKECITTWAGPIAERLFTGKDFSGEDGDATYLSRLLFSGVIEKGSGKIVLLLPKDEATALLKKSGKFADVLMRASWAAVAEIAQAIVRQQRISGEEVKVIVDKHGRERMLAVLTASS